MSNSAGATQQGEPEGLFVEIDEEDPFEEVRLSVLNGNGVAIPIGTIEADPGRYELRKVENDD